MAPEQQAGRTYSLPVLVAGPIDVGRLIRELETLDTMLLQTKLKDGDASMPKTSRLMGQLVELNKLNIGDEAQRKQLLAFLQAVKKSAPVLHISFSADPNVAFIEKIMSWLRREIHPLVLMTIGLQPNIGAGCVVRSTNKYFDFTLRKNFDSKRDLLVSNMGAAEVTANRQPSPTAAQLVAAAKPVSTVPAQPAAPVPQGVPA